MAGSDFPKDVPRSRRAIRVFLMIGLFAFGYMVGRLDPIMRFKRARNGALAMIIASEREQRLREIHAVIEGYHQVHGEWPQKWNDLKHFQQGYPNLVDPPSYGGRYRIKFDRLGEEGDRIIVMDPGVTVPWFSGRNAYLCRRVLFRSGRVVPHSLVLEYALQEFDYASME